MIKRASEQDDRYLECLAGVEFEPVFIIGPHRSGTTFLNQLLIDTGRFNFTSVFHILNRDRLLTLRESGGEQQAEHDLQRQFEELDLKTRGYDDIEVCPQMPEEYAYALERQGRRPVLKPENLQSFLTFCRKVQYLQGVGRPLLLKNPFDANHFLYAAEVMPQARFIFIFRNPVEIISSQLKAIRYSLEQKCEYDALVSERYRRIADSRFLLPAARLIYSDRLPFLFEQILHHVASQCDFIVHNIGKLGDRACTIRYADLCERPRVTLAKVMSYLGQPVESITESMIASVRPRHSALAPEAAKAQKRILRRVAAYCKEFGV